MKPALARSVREMTPRASPSVFTTTRALIWWVFIVCATSGSVVSGAQTITPSCIHSRTIGSVMVYPFFRSSDGSAGATPGGRSGRGALAPLRADSRTSGSPMGRHLVSPRRHRDLEDLAEAPPGRAEVFLDHRLPTLAEELPHRALHRPVDLLVRVGQAGQERRRAEEDAEQHDPLHPHLELRPTRGFARNLLRVQGKDPEAALADDRLGLVGDPFPDGRRVRVGRLDEHGAARGDARQD